MAFKKTALVVVDVQKFFIEDATEPIDQVVQLCDYFTKRNLPIYFIQHGHDEAELTSKPITNPVVRKWGPAGSVVVGSPGWELMDQLSPFLPAYPSPLPAVGTCFPNPESNQWPKVVFKDTYDAFVRTQLDDSLSHHGIERLLVCGLVTDCCAETTARGAFNRGYETWLIGDACGTRRKDQHDAYLKGFGFAFGDVYNTAEALKALH